MARPPGSRNLVPSKAEVAERLSSLRRRADQGDALAAAALVLVALAARSIHSHPETLRNGTNKS